MLKYYPFGGAGFLPSTVAVAFYVGIMDVCFLILCIHI